MKRITVACVGWPRDAVMEATLTLEGLDRFDVAVLRDIVRHTEATDSAARELADAIVAVLDELSVLPEGVTVEQSPRRRLFALRRHEHGAQIHREEQSRWFTGWAERRPQFGHKWAAVTFSDRCAAETQARYVQGVDVVEVS